MMLAIDLSVLFVSGVLLLVAGVLSVQVLASFLPERETSFSSNEEALPSFVVIMPAHDEESIIEQSVRQLLGHLGSRGRLLVVADNCSDDTACRARSAGAKVIERNDPDRRGKGYALAYGVASLAATPADVVLILDADCRVAHRETLTMLAKAARDHQCPVQGLYDMLVPPGSGLKHRVAAFAWAFKSRVRAEGYRRLGLPCHLMGSGMAFPWSLLEQIDLATGHIVEDLKLGLDCALAGSPPMYLPAASVESEFPINEQGSRSQRERWEHGHLSMLTSEIPGLMVQAIRHRNGKLFAMCVDVCIPPLSLLGVVILSNALLALVLSSLHWISPFTIAVAMAALMVFGVTVLVGWWSVGRRLVSSIDLIMIPIYVFSKIPIYIGFFLRKRVAWIRTRRD